MIEALEVTLAPLVRGEKPQDSPRLAASFISNIRHINMLRAAGTPKPQQTASIGTTQEEANYACPDWLFAIAWQEAMVRGDQSNGAHQLRRPLEMMLLILGAGSGAIICDNSICVGRHNFATSASGGMRSEFREVAGWRPWERIR